MKRRLLIPLAVLAVASIATMIVFAARPRPTHAYYIINNPCESCREYETFLEHFQGSLGAQAALCPVTKVNLLTDEGRQTLGSLCRQWNIPREDRIAPMLIIGGQYLLGLDNIKQNGPALYDAVRQGRRFAASNGVGIPAASASAGQASNAVAAGDSYLLYFTTELCAACKQSSAWLATLPQQAEVSTAQGTTQSKVILDTRSTTEQANMDLLTSLYEKWNVPADQRTVPVVFYQTGYLRGVDAIQAGLLQEIKDGHALGYDGMR